MKSFIQFLTLVGELFSVYVLTSYMATLVLALIIGGGAAVTLIAWIFIVIVAFFVIVPGIRCAFAHIRKYFEVNLPGDFKTTTAGA